MTREAILVSIIAGLLFVVIILALTELDGRNDDDGE